MPVGENNTQPQLPFTKPLSQVRYCGQGLVIASPFLAWKSELFFGVSTEGLRLQVGMACHNQKGLPVSAGHTLCCAKELGPQHFQPWPGPPTLLGQPGR